MLYLLQYSDAQSLTLLDSWPQEACSSLLMDVERLEAIGAAACGATGVLKDSTGRAL